MSDACKPYEIYGLRKKMLAYIFVNEIFGSEQGNRPGAKKDVENMKNMFSFLNFDVHVFENQSGRNMQSLVEQALEREDLSEVSCFACVISSHGEQLKTVDIHSNTLTEEHVILGVDGQSMLTQNLVNVLHNCAALSGKPKLIFLQACRNDQFDDGVDVIVETRQEITKHRSHDGVDGIKRITKNVRPVTPAEDMLVMFASPEGHFAWRNSKSGGWLLSKLHSVMKTHSDRDTLRETDLLTVLTEVSRQVATEMLSKTDDPSTSDKKMAPVIVHKLTKDIFFM